MYKCIRVINLKLLYPLNASRRVFEHMIFVCLRTCNDSFQFRSNTMALLVDKHRPHSLDQLTYHSDLSNRLRSLVSLQISGLTAVI